MLNLNNISEEDIMKIFWNRVAGKRKVIIGYIEYIRPLNYMTDDDQVIVEEELPILDLKGRRLEMFKKALTEYVNTFIKSDLIWASPVIACRSEEDLLVHAISTIWLNATPEDFENPIQFLNRYTNFLNDRTFEEFWEAKQINNVQSLHGCTIKIAQKHQDEFQETPTSIIFTIEKDGIQKILPRIAYGISEGTAYIYGIQGESEKDTNSAIKKVNRSRYSLNKTENIPEDYKSIVFEQEPYAYISLFIFFNLLKQKGITKVVMPSYLPQRVANKKLFIQERISETLKTIDSEAKNRTLKDLKENYEHYKRIQYNITDKFLNYVSRMECDVPGVRICETPDQTNGSMTVDISGMKATSEKNKIFMELSRKIESLFKDIDKSEEGR